MKDSIRTTEEVNSIVAAVIASDFVVGDDHNGGRNTMRCDAIGVFKRYSSHGDLVTTEVVPLIEGTYFSINPLYIDDDGNVRLSVISCGGVVDASCMALEDAITKFNGMNWLVGRQEITLLAHKGRKEVA